VISHALRRSRADARQTAQRINQLIQATRRFQ
jgi:hypothetical protein